MQSNSRAPLIVSSRDGWARQPTEVVGLGDAPRRRVARLLGQDTEHACGIPELFRNDCFVGEVPAGAAVYASWRLAVLPEDEAHLPVGFATVGAGAHPLVRGLGKAWWNLTGRRTDRYRYMLFPKSHSRRSSRPRRPSHRPRIRPHTAGDSRCLRAAIRTDPVNPEIAGRVASGRASILRRRRDWRASTYLARRRAALPEIPRARVRRLERLMDAAEPSYALFGRERRDEIVAAACSALRPRVVCCIFRAPPRGATAGARRTVSREDLIDMLLLARTQRLFASYLSTFSEAAWWLAARRQVLAVF